MKTAMIQKSVKRREQWVDFHAGEIGSDAKHEQKLRFNYFADPSLTNPALHDFRPSSIDMKHQRPGMNMYTDHEQVLNSSQNVIRHTMYEPKITKVQRDRQATDDKHLPFRMGDKSEHERLKRSIKNNVKADTDEFDLSLMTNPQWRKIEKNKWINQTNQFFFKKCEKPCWSPRPPGLGDNEPHICDDKREVKSPKGMEETKSAFTPMKQAKVLHQARNIATSNELYPTSYANFQKELDPRVKRFGAESRHDVIWSDKVH